MNQNKKRKLSIEKDIRLVVTRDRRWGRGWEEGGQKVHTCGNN